MDTKSDSSATESDSDLAEEDPDDSAVAAGPGSCRAAPPGLATEEQLPTRREPEPVETKPEPDQSADPAAGNPPVPAATVLIASDARVCLNCGCTQARSWVKEKSTVTPSNTSMVRWECAVCARYRATHAGTPRPPRLWKQPPRHPKPPAGAGSAPASRAAAMKPSRAHAPPSERAHEQRARRQQRRERIHAWKETGLPPPRMLLQLRHMWACGAEQRAREKLQLVELAETLGHKLAGERAQACVAWRMGEAFDEGGVLHWARMMACTQ